MDLGLTQRAVAGQIGVDNHTITTWEANREAPALRHRPAVVRFLGHDPVDDGASLADQLRAYRLRHGLSQKKLARQLGVNENTVGGWEGGTMPGPDLAAKLEALLRR